MSTSARIPVAILGGSGYVAGELIRLVSGHPRFTLAAVASSSQVGESVVAAFPHLAGTAADGLAFSASLTPLLARGTPLGVFAATPHGATANLIDELLTAAHGDDLRVVDLSADFRFADAAAYQAIYGAHPAPTRLGEFVCAVPEHLHGKPARHVTQPGCFTTAVVLAAYPFLAEALVGDDIFVSAITGSAGSGRKLSPGTHHPERRSNLFAYKPLGHRHEAEMRLLLAAARGGRAPTVDFVPHSGPMVRGIHATLRMELHKETPASELVARVNRSYAHTPFVHATLEPPKLTEVVGTNRCRLGIAVRGKRLVVTSVIDNLVKGAAGGAVQWMNRLYDLPDETGLTLAGLGWY
ncbi:MAG: N-acetyl-gamma-glutamyl-phosphate reductase [Myxococcota bacterium]